MNISYNPVQKPKHGRNKQKRAARGKFSPDTIERIFDHDKYCCAYCKSNRIDPVPHHCVFKSAMGEGTFENGATVCNHCHRWAHGLIKGVNGEPTSEGRKWFEEYSKRKLLIQSEALE